jgi:hypothetical protein
MAGNDNNANVWQAAVSATKECPTVEVLERVMEESSSNPKAAAHVASCPHCQSEIAMLRSFESSAPNANEGAAAAWIAAQLERNQTGAAAKAQAPVVPFWRALFRVPYVAAAAALIMAIGLGVSFYISDGSKQPTLTTGTIGVQYRGGEIHLKTGGDLNQAPQQLTWEAVPGASRYSVKISDVTNKQLWQGNSTQNSINIDPELEAKMRQGKPLNWTVTAVDGNGKELATGEGKLRVVK